MVFMKYEIAKFFRTFVESKIQEFILEEAKLKNEAMSKTILTMQDKIDLDCSEISNLEKLIKSQVSNFKGSLAVMGQSNIYGSLAKYSDKKMIF